MYSRAASKLQLTNTVIQDGRFSLLDQAHSAAAGVQVSSRLHDDPVSPQVLVIRLPCPVPSS